MNGDCYINKREILQLLRSLTSIPESNLFIHTCKMPFIIRKDKIIFFILITCLKTKGIFYNTIAIIFLTTYKILLIYFASLYLGCIAHFHVHSFLQENDHLKSRASFRSCWGAGGIEQRRETSWTWTAVW